MNFPAASHTFLFKHPIWKIHPTGIQQLLIIETRDASSRTIVFYALNIETKECLQLPAYSILEQWWCSLEYCSDRLLVFSEYKDPNLPQPKGLKAYDYVSKDALWELPDMGIQHIYNESFTALDRNNNFKIYNYQGQEIFSPPLYTSITSPITSPSICTSQNFIFQDFLIFLQQNTLPLPDKMIEYFENEHFLVMSYAYVSNASQKYKFLIFDQTGHKVVDEHIFKNNKGLIAACFFIFGKSVLFLDNDYCLKGYEIT